MRIKSIFALALAAAIPFAVLAPTAEAASTYTQNAFSTNVTGTSVKLTANIKANPATQVNNAGFCTTDSANATVAYVNRPSLLVPTGGVTITQTATLPAGTYSSVPCVREGTTGTYIRVGAAKSFTIAAAGPTVLFQDNFDGAAGAKPDASKWGEYSSATYNGSAAYGNIQPGERSTLDGAGHLQIPATPTQGTGISTAKNFTFVYGTMTARIKVQNESGYWPSFWSLNSNPDGSTTSGAIGEADALEAYTQYNDGYRPAVHNYTSGNDFGPHNNPLCDPSGEVAGRPGTDIRGDYHDYSARIEPNKVTFSIDGTTCFVANKADMDTGGVWGFGPDQVNRGNWMILVNAVGNSSQGMSPPTQNSVLLVDSVKVTSL